MTSVIITGAAGFVGSNLLRHCLAKGWRVTAIDDMSNGHEEFLPKHTSYEMVFDDFASDQVLRIVEARQATAVVHLAANPRVPYSVGHPYETHVNNVAKTVRLLEACRHNCGRVVFASSCSVYGCAAHQPTCETFKTSPASPYALQKLEVENYLRLFNTLYGLDSVSLRFFNIYGPNALGDSPYTTALAAWLKAIRDNRPMRSDGDGSQTRDLVHVDDVCRAISAAASRKRRLDAQSINIGTGVSVSNLEILTRLEEMFPLASHVDAPLRAGDVHSTQADIMKAAVELHWKPEIDFWKGMVTTAEWAMESEHFSNLHSRV